MENINNKMNMYKIKERTILLFVSLTINAFANSLIAKAALGNSAWGVLALNISGLLNVAFGTGIIIASVIAFVVSRIIERKYDPVKDTLGLMAGIFYGSYINVFSYLIRDLPADTLLIRIILLVAGLLLMTFGISMYMRANVLLLPFDDSLKVVKENVTNGNIVTASYLVFGSVFLGALICGYFAGNIQGFTIGTVIIFFVFGKFIDFYDKHTKFIDDYIA